jgi:LysR family transcriptional regulator, regulator for metE and metH
MSHSRRCKLALSAGIGYPDLASEFSGRGRRLTEAKMGLEVRHLKLVKAVAEEGTVTRAADRLHLTQSALSHQLHDAEEQLGATLFERTSKKMKLTEAGERVLLSARTVLDELQRVEQDIESKTLPMRGKVRLTTQCYTVYHWLPSCLMRFMKTFSNVDVKVVVDAPDPFQALIEERVDLAIVCAPVRDRRIEYTRLFSDEAVAVVAPEHALAGKAYLSAEDFAGETLLVYPPKEESIVITKLLTPAGLAPRAIQELTLTEAMIELVKAGMGITVMTRWSIAPQLEEGSLIAVPLTREGLWREWSVARLRRKNTPAYIMEFLRLLTDDPLSGLAKRHKKVSLTVSRRPLPVHASAGPSHRLGERLCTQTPRGSVVRG